jgi:hypothetical protein
MKSKKVIYLYVVASLIAAYIYYQYHISRSFTYVYVDHFLDKADYTLLVDELKKYNERLNYAKETTDNVVRYNLVMNEPRIKQLLEKYQPAITHLTRNPRIYLAKNFPIEYRQYVPGSFMHKHRDQLIYTIPQYECVLTLNNTTDSVTKMAGKPIKAQPNSLMIVRAQGIEHEVTKVTQGERKFLKFIFTETDDKVAFV